MSGKDIDIRKLFKRKRLNLFKTLINDFQVYVFAFDHLLKHS